MARRGGSELELDFDGLTDSLTDLVGTLTLFVFLLFALSEEIKPEIPPQPVAHLPWDEAGKNRPTTELLRELTAMQAELSSLDGLVKQQESQTTSLRARIDELSRRAKSRGTDQTASIH